MRLLIFSVMLFVIMGCAPRGYMSFVAPDVAGAGVTKHIYSISNRLPETSFAGAGQHNDGSLKTKTLFSQDLSGKRSSDMNFVRLDISLPPSHEPGQIEWAKWQDVDVSKHVAVRDEVVYPTQSAFMQALDNEPHSSEVVLFVHGYNVNLSEATYRMAQLSNDYAIDGPVISFSWPSAARTAGYVYDRDSVIFSRDALEDVLLALVADGHSIALIAHSMGSQLVMETLRQMSIGKNASVLKKLARVILISPDIDENVFLSQAARIAPFPQNFTLMVSSHDRALGISSLLSGKPNRLGSIESPEILSDLPITIIDLSNVRGGDALGHSKALTAPTAIEQLVGLADRRRAHKESSIGLCVAVKGAEPCLQQASP